MQTPELLPIEPQETFRFACHCEVSCFNHCCRDLNQALTPYDVLRLKSHLNISTRDFLEAYAVVYTGPSTGLPVVSLRFGDHEEKRCPFVTPQGCKVYPSRPSSCRIYPLARALRRNRSDGRVREHYAVIRESHCHGFEEPEARTVRQWVADQQLAVYLEMNDALMEVIALKNQLRPGPLSAEHWQMAQMAFYDVEALTQKAQAEALPEMECDRLKPLPGKGDDEAWLRWGLQWITRALFGNRR